MTYPQYARDADDARLNYNVLRDLVGAMPSAVIEAEAKTGTRYVIAVTDQGDGGALITGGRFLVACLSPWQSVYATSGTVDDAYVREHWAPHREVHGGDVAAVTLAINEAIMAGMTPAPD